MLQYRISENSISTWIIIDLGRADKDFPVGDMVSACWRRIWFSDSEFESFSSNLYFKLIYSKIFHV